MTRAPLQNRVAPTGEIVSDSGRGLLTGNRGCLHGKDRRLRVARWRSKHWICCALSWKDVRRDPMPPGGWTALFFLDEATALAAGHRPSIDAQLHTERVDSRTRRQLTRPELVAELPDGVMVRYRGAPGLLLDECVFPWSFDGYRAPIEVPAATSVELLTPPASAATIAGGYRPLLHPSATGAGSSERLELHSLRRPSLLSADIL